MQQALALAADPGLYAIRVEAVNDIIDVELLSVERQLVKGFQFRRRNQGDTWGQQELIDELARWSGLAAENLTATYEFVTDGRLGRTGLKVRDALERAPSGDLHDIRELIAGKTGDVAVSDDSLTRAVIRAEVLAYADLISGAQTRAQALLLNVTSKAEAEERGRWVVLELVNMITERSGLPDENARLITRDEVLQLLATPQDRIPTKQWDDALKGEFCASVLARADERSVELACRPDVAIGAGSAAGPKLLEHWAEPGAVRLLAGASGSGKSTVVLDMQRRAAEHGVVVIAAHAEDYIVGRLEALIAAGLNRHAYIGAHPAVGTAALADPEVVIALDGVTEIPAETREKLEEELKQFLTAGQRAELVLVGRGVTAMRAMLTRSSAVTDLVVCPMSEDEQCQIVGSFYQLEPDLARWLVRRVGHAMQDVATNPLMLLLGAKAIALQGNASSPATIYLTVISDLAEQCGYPDASVLVVGLGMAYAELLDGQKRYCDTLDWVALLKEAAERLADAGHSVTVRRLREFGSETGLVRSAPFDTVRPFHDSFADFLAGVALSRSLADLPARLGEHDRARARFLAQLSGVSDRLAHLLTRDLPFTAVNVVPYERRSSESRWLDETKRHLDQLLPTAEVRPTVAYWEDANGRVVVTVGAGVEGWLGAAAPERAVIESGWTFRLGKGQGPLTVAVRIWHRWLDQHLTPPSLSGVAVPHTLEESCALLAEHSQALLRHRRELSSLMELAGPDADELAEAATQRIQFAISDHHVDEERDRGVWFRERAELTTGEEVLVGELPDPSAWTGRGSVDSFVTTGAAQSASRDLQQIINAMVGRTWL
ncbi:MAG: ATP-binding protein [Nocardiaceae bacterium]|uniref:AAA family ATPase n=1 Tax=Mycobacterium sp. 155 TaxID=1157943 RepID=UPI00039FAEAC|nr:ATP-binding protein [Mycobacterium sp. 155]MCE5290227.1 ATP-binding protein [Nocardiaceae bacterium]